MPLSKIARLSAAVAALITAAPLVAGVAATLPYNPYPQHFYRSTLDYTPNHPVFLRAGPTVEAPVIGVLRPGMPLRVTASANYGWMRVRSAEGTGWAYGSYLSPG